METKYLDIFPRAFTEVLAETGFSETNISDTDSPFDKSTEIIASVGITGAMQGYMMLNASLVSAKNFVDRMMHNIGMEIEEEGFGQFHKEAIGEMVNQFSGRSVMILHESEQIDCNITPPTIITGNSVYADMTNLIGRLSKEVRGDFGVFQIFIGIKDFSKKSDNFS